MSILARCHMELGDLDSALYYACKADVLKVPGNDPYGYANFKLTWPSCMLLEGRTTWLSLTSSGPWQWLILLRCPSRSSTLRPVTPSC